MTLGADNMQTAGREHLGLAFVPGRTYGRHLVLIFRAKLSQFRAEVTAQHDIGTATSHVGRDRHTTRPTGLGHDLRFLLVKLGVQHFVLDVLLVQQTGQIFRSLDRSRTDQHRLTTLRAVLDIVDDGLEFFLSSQEYQITAIVAHHWSMGRDHYHFEAVDLLELIGLGVSGAGHTGQLLVETEVVLVGD